MADYTVRFQPASDTVFYSAKAAPGSLTSDPVWQIRRTTITLSPYAVTMLFANGSAAFNQVWDDHLSLSYS